MAPIPGRHLRVPAPHFPLAQTFRMHATIVPGGPGRLPNYFPGGFTLIELLIVCALLAAVSMLTWGSYLGVDRETEDELARVELLQLADALRRFHADTGYWPGEGPFALADSETCSGSGGAVLRSWTAPSDDSARDAWFSSPANLALLFEQPELCNNHPLAFLASWDATHHRGWNGPYLPLASRQWVDIGSDGTVSGDKVVDVPGIGIGPTFPPVDTAYTTCDAADAGCFLSWRSLPSSSSGYVASKHEYTIHARPFSVLGLADNSYPRVVYWGSDGHYGGVNESAPCQPNASNEYGADDRVICL